MSLHFKMIIPLLYSEITKEDLDIKNGFYGAFSYDMNRPSLRNHIMLMYDGNCTSTNIERMRRFKMCPSLYSTRHVKIGGFDFVCYTFTIVNKTIDAIKNDYWHAINDDELLRIDKFWNFTDPNVNRYMIHGDELFSEKFEHSAVPEWDYDPNDRNPLE